MYGACPKVLTVLPLAQNINITTLPSGAIPCDFQVLNKSCRTGVELLVPLHIGAHLYDPMRVHVECAYEGKHSQA